MDRIITTKALIILGWSLFILCLFLPVEYEESKLNGFVFAGFAIERIPLIFNWNSWPTIPISGISNILALFSIFIIYIKNVRLLIYLSLLFFVFFINNASYNFPEMKELSSGYYSWLISYIILTIGCILQVKSLTKRSSGTNNP